jgi:hypothetical protein
MVMVKLLANIIPTPEIVFMGFFAMGSFAGPLASVFRITGDVSGFAFLPVNVFSGFAMNFFRFSVFKQIIFI